jgi:hypothetical protein
LQDVDPSLFSLHLIEGRVIPDWKKIISSGENIIRFLGDYIAKHIRQNSNVISIKDIDDNGCKLKTRDLIIYKIKCHLTKGSKPFFIYWLQQRH